MYKDATESLWMHEYGHTKTLKHPYEDYDNLLMNSNLNPGQFNVDNGECALLLGIAQAITKAPNEQGKGTQKIGIEEFVRQIHVHGFPIDRARQYAPAEISRVVPWLRDPQKQLAWPNIVMLMGVAGEPDYADELITFLEHSTISDGMAHQAGVSVPIALGQIVRWSDAKRGQRALNYLHKHTRPSSWGPAFGGSISTELSEYAIIALGETGSLEGAEVLHKLLNIQEPFFRQPSIQTLIQEAITVNSSFR